MNQHDRIEQAIAEHDAQAERDRNLVQALRQVEHTIGLLAWHVERTLTDSEARFELAGELDTLRRAIRKVEDQS